MSYERSSNVDITKFTKLTPSFSESKPEVFFSGNLNLPSCSVTGPKINGSGLKRNFTGKAIKVCEGLEKNTDYNEGKTAVLTSYSITTEGYRQSFRNQS